MKRWRNLLLGLLVSGATLWFALRDQDFSKIGDELLSGRYLWAVPCLVFVVVGLMLRGARWQVLLGNRTDWAHSFHIMNVGYFFNALLPFRLGEVARAYLVTRLTPPISIFTALSSVVAERLTDLLAVVVLVVVAVLIAPVSVETQRVAQGTGAAAIFGILVLGFFAARRALVHRIADIGLKLLPFLNRLNPRHIIDRMLDGVAPLGSPRSLALVLFWGGLAWATSVIAGFVLMYAFYDQPNWESALLMIAAASLAISVPAVPGSVGPFELAVIAGLQAGGMINAANPSERALAFAVVLHIINVGSYAALGLIGLSFEKITFGEVIRSARQLVPRSAAPQSSDQQ